MERLTWLLGGLLRAAAWLLPPGRRPWAEAVEAEAGEIPAGWPRLHWLAGGLWLVAREANVVRKVVYWLGAGAVAAAAAWAIWLSWRAVPAPYDDPQAVTDRVRVLVGVAALAVLPWVGRRHGWFGPVGGSVTARLVRVAGCVAMCGTVRSGGVGAEAGDASEGGRSPQIQSTSVAFGTTRPGSSARAINSARSRAPGTSATTPSFVRTSNDPRIPICT